MKSESAYRLDRLPVVQAFHWRSRAKSGLRKGELVYYGPFPASYGIGEVNAIVGSFVAVNFRGTGEARVHHDVIHERYLIPITKSELMRL
ncbi:MAG: DUF3553 domain-containing protein [Bacteroidota bacterium]|nr:DUF3553 domain-containing protein [Bacteroidota bacterium]MDE2833513.1 DUF3553 domain-containing protein [Bacteroidota bacterium]MDE2958214.1 DUF3553 domain-containing protein [Bacteroidota bacterium]